MRVIMNTCRLGRAHLKGALKRARTRGSTVRNHIMEQSEKTHQVFALLPNVSARSFIGVYNQVKEETAPKTRVAEQNSHIRVFVIQKVGLGLQREKKKKNPAKGSGCQIIS